MKILQNEIICNHCGDQIYSRHRHDYVTCKCGKVGVDGGMSYLRRTGLMREDYTDVSVAIEDSLYDDLIEALDWANASNRNSLEALCVIMRVIRDNGYRITKKEEYERQKRNF